MWIGNVRRSPRGLHSSCETVPQGPAGCQLGGIFGFSIKGDDYALVKRIRLGEERGTLIREYKTDQVISQVDSHNADCMRSLKLYQFIHLSNPAKKICKKCFAIVTQ
jgi:hypothetical protein